MLFNSLIILFVVYFSFSVRAIVFGFHKQVFVLHPKVSMLKFLFGTIPTLLMLFNLAPVFSGTWFFYTCFLLFQIHSIFLKFFFFSFFPFVGGVKRKKITRKVVLITIISFSLKFYRMI